MTEVTTKITSAGLIKAVIAALPDGGSVSLEALVQAHDDAGIPSDSAKVYANVQSLATHGKVGRGVAARTYCKVSDVDEAARKVAKTPAPREKKVAARKDVRTYTNEEVFAELTEKLGEPVQRGDELSNLIVLLGDASGQYLIDRSEMALGTLPTHWFQDEVGPNVAVGLFVR